MDGPHSLIPRPVFSALGVLHQHLPERERARARQGRTHMWACMVEVLYCNTLLLHRITGERLKKYPWV